MKLSREGLPRVKRIAQLRNRYGPYPDSDASGWSPESRTALWGIVAPKGCDKFLPLDAGPVGFSLLTDRYGLPSLLLHGEGDFLRHAGAGQCNMCPVGSL